MLETITAKPVKYKAAIARYRQNANIVALPLLTCFCRSISRSIIRLTTRTQTSVTILVAAINSAVSAMLGKPFSIKFSCQLTQASLLPPNL